MNRRSFILASVLILASYCAPCRGQDTLQPEADRLASLLQWQAGSMVGEIGAGDGRLTLAAAERVGPSEKVYSNELDPEKVSHLRELAASHTTIVVVQGADTSANLPPACCDSIFMRLVYHHFTKPSEMDASLLRSLKPDGRLAVIDEEPQAGSSIPPGVPKNRIGHGIPQRVLIDELTAAGFTLESVHNDWPNQMYCVVFRKAKD